MINIKFINNEFQEWTKLKLENSYIWHTRQIEKIHIKKIQALISLKNDLNIKMLKTFLLNIKCHFGLVIINNNIVIAATDVARTYPLFYNYL